MVCSNCGQENGRLKFCTKCGAKSNAGLANKLNSLSYLSLILPIVGFIGFWVIRQIVISHLQEYIQRFGVINNFSVWIAYSICQVIQTVFVFPIIAGFIFAFLTLYKKKILLLVIGLVPCIHFIVITLMILIGNISELQYVMQHTR